MARSDAELRRRANSFATEIEHLLNQTVCDYARVGASIQTSGIAAVATGLTRGFEAEACKLRSPGGAVCAWLELRYRVFLDEDGYLTVLASYCGLSTDRGGEELMFHYDYERDKTNYTEAHLQFDGSNPHLARLMAACGRGRDAVLDLHFPVGGRRFRPTLEDILEFLIDEQLVEAAPGAGEILELSRKDWRKKQLRAAIRRDPDTAVEALNGLGYTGIQPPKQKQGGR